METADKPKWQRAKIIKARKDDESIIGRTLWVEIGPPQAFLGIRAYNINGTVKKSVGDSCLRYATNLMGAEGEIGVPAQFIELLSGDDDFRVSVDRIGVQEWLMLKVDGVEK